MSKIVNRLLTVFLIVTGAGFAVESACAFEPFQPLPPQPPIPADNPQTEAKAALGKMLFFDRRLSVNDSLSCNSCHDLARAGSDYRPLSTGATGLVGKRSTLTLFNAAYETVYFWDGRAESLEQAVASHLLDDTVMAMPSRRQVNDRIAAIGAYAELFDRNFPGEGVTYENITRALASFIRTLRTPDSAFDRYLGGDKQAISKSAKRGFRTFVDSGCGSCHFWVNLSGPVPGLAFKMGEGFYELFPNYTGTDEERRYHLTDDLGRIQVTRVETDRRMWRVPILRNIALTAPYFHNGSVATLDEAVRVMAKTQLGKVFSDQELADVTAFLGTLSGKRPTITLPQLP